MPTAAANEFLWASISSVKHPILGANIPIKHAEPYKDDAKLNGKSLVFEARSV